MSSTVLTAWWYSLDEADQAYLDQVKRELREAIPQVEAGIVDSEYIPYVIRQALNHNTKDTEWPDMAEEYLWDQVHSA